MTELRAWNENDDNDNFKQKRKKEKWRNYKGNTYTREHMTAASGVTNNILALAF
jgi:hypothetical protein